MLLGNYLIGLREGLEAALVVSILIAYLVKTGRRGALAPVWAGIGLAIGLSVAFGVLLSVASSEMQFKTQEFFGGSLSIVAVGLLVGLPGGVVGQVPAIGCQSGVSSMAPGVAVTFCTLADVLVSTIRFCV